MQARAKERKDQYFPGEFLDELHDPRVCFNARDNAEIGQPIQAAVCEYFWICSDVGAQNFASGTIPANSFRTGGFFRLPLASWPMASEEPDDCGK